MATIYTPSAALAGNAGGSSANNAIRIFCPTTAGNQGQLRVSFSLLGSASGNMQVIHASIGISTATPSTNMSTTGITELLFSGSSGFTLTPGGTITSDWLTFAGAGSATLLAVHLDFPDRNQFYSYGVGEAANNDSWYSVSGTGGTDYNNNTPTSGNYSQQTTTIYGIATQGIETQPAPSGGGAVLRRAQAPILPWLIT